MKKMSCKLQAAFYCHLLEIDINNLFYMGNAFEMSLYSSLPNPTPKSFVWGLSLKYLPFGMVLISVISYKPFGMVMVSLERTLSL